MKQREAIAESTPEVYSFKELLEESVKIHGELEAYTVKLSPVSSKEEPVYRHVSYNDFMLEIRKLSTALRERFPEGSFIALMSENRYEWCLSYLSIACAGFVVVPVDRELKTEEVKTILTASRAAGIICSQKIYEKSVKEAVSGTETKTICMDNAESEEYSLLGTLLEEGGALIESGKDAFYETPPKPDGLSVLIFTSGTTGVAKGVMLSQKNICSDIISVMRCLDNSSDDTMLSILPIHHTFECTCSFLTLLRMGGTLTFCDGLRYIGKNIQEYKPTIIMLVPLIIENMYSKVIKQAKSSKVKWLGFKFLLWLSGVLNFFGIDAGRKLFPQIHESMGGRLRLLIAGAAPMSPKVLKDMRRMGFKIRQGYGLTECAPILCVNRENGNEFKSVGPAMPGIEVKIDKPDADGNGEILAKGENIMLGYFENEDATNAVFTEDGWFRTGDRGVIDKYGRVFITGRVKTMIVNKTGKNIFPEELEALLGRIPYIKECVVWGDNSSADEDTIICATVVPEENAVKNALKEDAEDTDKVKELIWHEVKKINKDLATYKKIQRIDIRKEEFEKTTTSKIKRYVLNLTGKGNKN